MTEFAEPSRIETNILDYLVAEGASTRVDIQQHLEVSRPTMSNAVVRLMQRGLIEESGTAEYGVGRNGRPRALLTIRREVGAVLGIELGRARIAITAVSIDGSTALQRLESVSDEAGVQDKLDMAVSWLREWAERGSLRRSALLGVGLALAGQHEPLDNASRVARLGPVGLNLEGLRRVVDAPLMWDNNTRLAAIKHLVDFDEETLAAGILYVVLSSGISAGIVDARGIYRGGHGVAGEIGHLSINFEGAPCWCGALGCLEAYCGQSAVLASARDSGCQVAAIEDLIALVASGDPVALGVAERAGRALGVALASATMLGDPGSIVLTGAVSKLGAAFVDAARVELARRRSAIAMPVANVYAAEGSEYDASQGAAISALRRWGVAHALKQNRAGAVR